MSAFSDCNKLTSVTIQGTGVTLDGLAFWGCTNLSELNIPDGDKVLLAEKDADGIFTNDTKLPLKMRARLKTMLGDAAGLD
jgi:hypothetical protein